VTEFGWVEYFWSGDSIAITKKRGRRNTVEIGQNLVELDLPESTSISPASVYIAAQPVF
jgi:hypothetical protein